MTDPWTEIGHRIVLAMDVIWSLFLAVGGVALVAFSMIAIAWLFIVLPAKAGRRLGAR